MKKAAIIGGTGYGAIELIRLIHSHPKLEVTKVISQSQSGEVLSSIYPHLLNLPEIKLVDLDIPSLEQEVDIVFLATPAGVAKNIIPELQKTELQVIDLSGDLRLASRAEYEEWYGQPAAPQATIDEAVYGLSEIYAEKINKAKIISNPGCFPTSALLGLIPGIESGVISPKGISIDGKTGVSGAGRTPSGATHFSETNDNVTPYKIGKHQHIPEIENYLSDVLGEKVLTTFTSHLIPMTRGLICTIYANVNETVTTSELIEKYKAYYEGHPFIRILPEGQFPSTKAVVGSNFCDIGIFVDERTQQVIIASAIDNLVKGASGQAIQNANLMNGWDETLGLDIVPMYP
ncbi:N-acetyl-gamma-glutamyl-phosphate reductase [Oceanobacillus sp. CAU 1775]